METLSRISGADRGGYVSSFGQISISISIILPGFDKDWKRRGSMEFFFTSNSRNFVHTRGLLFISFSISMLTSHLLIFLFENKDAPLFESLRNFNYLSSSFTIIGKVSAWFLFPKKNRRFVSFISLANSFTFPFVNFSIENQAGLLHFRFHYP